VTEFMRAGGEIVNWLLVGIESSPGTGGSRNR